MEPALHAIRAALAADATLDARAAGVAACRAILATLEAAPPSSAAPPATPTQVAAIVGSLRGLPPDQLLDLAIAKLRAALPAGTDVGPVAPLQFHILPVPSSLGGRP